MLATQVISRLAKSFQVSIPLRSLFETPTIAGLALTVIRNLVEKIVPEGIDQVLVTLKEELIKE